MKLIISTCLLIISSTLLAQEITKASILTAFAQGDEIAKLIEDSDLIGLNNSLDTTTAREIIALVENETYTSGEYKVFRDIFFYPKTNSYRFTIYAAKWIETDSKWGLNDYLFILELQINYDHEVKTASVGDYILLDQNSDLKRWWRFFISSYRDPAMMRDRWAKDFKLVPPPPPPPQTTEWFEE